MFLEEIEKARHIYSFHLWAYVLMPNHAHALLWPMTAKYDISKILSGIKRVMSKRYGIYLKDKDKISHDRFLLEKGDSVVFTFWQPGGGFDRNLWNAKAIHNSINYIEANPIRKNLVRLAEEWKWSSANARFFNKGVVPDKFAMPVLMPNPQADRIRVV